MTHPITPPPELVREWLDTLFDEGGLGIDPHKLSTGLAARAAQWGADQELEACCEYVYERLKVTTVARIAQELRDARRPNPPSLKDQALALIDGCNDPDNDYLDDNALATIRRALEVLPDD
jgi:hypothetical protein